MNENTTDYSDVIDEETAERELGASTEKAKKIINDPDKLDYLIQRAEKKIRSIPHVGEMLANIPTMIGLIKDFVAKEYTLVPVGSILAIIGVVLYFVSPFDFLPDCIPIVGYLDDAAVCSAALRLMGSDIEEYRVWRRENGKEVVDFDAVVNPI